MGHPFSCCSMLTAGLAMQGNKRTCGAGPSASLRMTKQTNSAGTTESVRPQDAALLFFFVVFLFGVDFPEDAFVHVAGDDVVDGGHGGEHGVVLVVVFVHAVAAYQE